LDARGEVEDGLDRSRLEDARHRVSRTDVGAYEVDVGRQRICMPCREIVDDDHAMAIPEERTHHVRSDVPGAACHENVHG
jgi:hypothetical protein